MTRDECLHAAVWTNKYLFANRLERHRVELVNIRHIAGCYAHNHRGGLPTIRLNSELVRKAETAMQVTEVLATIAHEQCHMLSWLDGDTSHGIVWQTRMYGIGLRPVHNPNGNGGYGDWPIPDSPFSECAQWIATRFARRA